MPELRHRAITGTDGHPPTRPFKPYTYGGETAEPPAVIAARARHQATDAAIAGKQRELEEAAQSGVLPASPAGDETR